MKQEEKVIKPKFCVGDKIVDTLRKQLGCCGSSGKISQITDNEYIFTDGSHLLISNQDNWELVSNKEETIEEIKIDIPKGYEFFGVDDDNQQVVFTKIQPEYPKTYDECEKILGLEESIIEGCLGYEYKLLNAFQKLLMCRDAYWKLAGEQMGLGKPWEPDWVQATYTCTIICRSNNIVKDDGFDAENKILAFPTEEMRDVFYDNFKELIEQCKELL